MQIFLYNFKYIILIKLALLTLFTSEYIHTTLYPFVSFFIDTFENPWQYYIDNNLNTNAFPYQPLVLYFFTFFALPFKIFGLENYDLIVNFFLKFPLFLTDIGIFLLLLKVYSRHSRKVVFFYFFNPVIIYAIYILSLPEIIPIALLFLSVFYVYIKKSIYRSAIVFGLTLSTSFNFLIALPLILIYLYKIDTSVKKLISYMLIVLLIPFFWDLPYLFSDGFVKMVVLNKMQFIFFDTYFPIGHMKLYMSLFVFSFIYYLFYRQRKVDYEILLVYFGILFTATVSLVSPSPELYVWMIPFTSAFFIRQINVNHLSLLYIGFNVVYLLFFMLFFQSGYNEIIFVKYTINFGIESNSVLGNILFSILLVFNVIMLFVFYQVGIKNKSVYKRERNLVIGIGGDSGAGKSLLLNDIALLLNEKLLKLEGDGEHKWERGDQNWGKYTHLDPKANFIYKQASIISQLKVNKSVYRSDYDHNTGKFTAPFRVEPKEFISISALHPFYLSYMRNRIDFKIYIDTDESLRRHWKIIRDVASRGYTLENIIEQIEKRVGDSKKYIYPQKKFADLVIRYYPLHEFELGNKSTQVELGLKLTFSANIQIEKLLNIPGLDMEWDYNDDLNSQHVNIKKEPDINFENLANEMIINADRITAYEHTWLSGYKGLVQLFVILIISEIMRRE